MYLAMNRFKIAPGFEAGFEKIWRERDTYLSEVPGFVSFHLLRGPETEEHVLYASHTVWESEDGVTFVRVKRGRGRKRSTRR